MLNKFSDRHQFVAFLFILCLFPPNGNHSNNSGAAIHGFDKNFTGIGQLPSICAMAICDWNQIFFFYLMTCCAVWLLLTWGQLSLSTVTHSFIQHHFHNNGDEHKSLNAIFDLCTWIVLRQLDLFKFDWNHDAII